ncbi:unnamed protein product [Periconia digitata]|uniref:Uncharacterized protein n=1 Tax=Periconia digitata TaxID=1303443 RepID=A0A9W4XS76_9PLEO|nr:unnamed protein product [Periconia digitata]
MFVDPTNRLRYIEAWDDDGMIRMRSGLIFHDDYENWLSLKGNHNIELSTGNSLSAEDMALRLVTRHHPGYPYSIGHCRALIDRLSESFNLHRSTEEAFINNNGVFVKYTSKDNEQADVNHFALVLKIPVWVKGCQALSVSYCPKTGSVRAFINWLTDKDHALLLEHLRSLPHKTALRHPLLLPTYILQLHRTIMEPYRYEVDQSILRIENRIGYAVPGLLYYKPVTDQLLANSAEGHGLQDIVRRLHACNTELGGIAMEATFGKEYGVFLKKTLLKLNEWHMLPEEDNWWKASEYLRHDIDFTTNLFFTVESQVSILKDRVLSHINLTFSIIAQEENKLSRAVAENSKRYSAAMKTVALVTLLFLPPTFVATLFSMSMFDWNGEKPIAETLSSYFWIYWAIAAPLTFAVWFIWHIWWKMEEKKHMKELRASA